MYKNKDIKKIANANNIVDVVGEYVTLHKRGSRYYASCPFHTERFQSFMVDPQKQQYHCFGCGAGGNVFSFVMQQSSCSFPESVDKLAARAGITGVVNEKETIVEEKMRRLYQINDLACAFFYQRGRSDESMMRYLKGERKLSDATIKKFQIGLSGHYGCELYNYLRSKGCSNEELLESGLIGYQAEQNEYYDKFWDRIMFPIQNEHRKIVGFGGRAFGDKKPKYLNSPETVIFDKSHELYGLSLIKDKSRPFVLCEGYVDVISMHQAGCTNAVASLGTSLTYSQAKIIRKHTDTVFVAYDSDEAGVKAAARAVSILESVGLKVFVASTAPFKDVDELIKADNPSYDETRKRLKEAVQGKTFLVQLLKKTNADNFYEEAVKLLV